MENLPTVSLARLRQSDTRSQETAALLRACSEIGCFYLSDHGVPECAIDAAICTSRTFFELPPSVKQRYGHEAQHVHPKASRGYIPPLGETLYEPSGPDHKESFDLGIDRPGDTEAFNGPNLLPDETTAPGFATAHKQLQSEIMTNVVPEMICAIAQALGLKRDYFDPYFSKPTLIQRCIYYPLRAGNAGKHTDNGFFTLLIQESLRSPSLRVMSDGRWIPVPAIKGTFAVFLGDILQRWTGERFVSTPHEVIHTCSAGSRVSIPFFLYPNIDAMPTPLQGSEPSFSIKRIMLDNFSSIWIEKKGAGRAQDL